MSDPRNSSQIRCSNIRALLKAIKENMPVSKRDLQKITGLSWGAVSTLTGVLYNQGYVVSAGKQITSVGRKPAELDINSDDNFIVGIDLNMSGLCGIVTDMKGRIIREWVRLFARDDYDCVMETLLSLLDEIVLQEFPHKRILGIGLAVQGIVDYINGVSVNLAQLHNWKNVPLKEILEKRYGYYTLVMHDPQCIMIAEKAFGESFMSIAKDAILIRIDNGIGMSAMVNGQLHLGSNGKVGEFGHIPVEKDGPLCACGNRGCLEEFSSGSGIVHRFVERVNRGEKTSANVANIYKEGFKELAAAAKHGDALCLDLFRQMGEYFGVALSTLINIMNPDLVVLYGNMTDYRQLYLPEVQKELDAHLYTGTQAKIVFSSLGRNAAAQGAALLVSDYIVDTLDLPVGESDDSNSGDGDSDEDGDEDENDRAEVETAAQ